MSRHAPLFVRAATAAAILDMTPREFRALVQTGALPAPCVLAGDIQRWDVEELRATLRGQKPKPRNEDLEL